MNHSGLQFQSLFEEATSLLASLIETPSLSKEEEKTGDLIAAFFEKKNIKTQRKGNNIWAYNRHFDSKKPSILLNSHHDTVKPNAGYTKDPYKAIIEDGRIYGLGSNDAGGCLVSLIGVFCYFFEKEIPYNLILAATAEEEISGKNGIESILNELPELELAIVGEPTLMQMAVAEKGLLVIDAILKGKAGHAAREEGENAIYKALDDLNKIRDFQFEKISPYLGKTKVTATLIQAGSQHNVIPDICTYTLDVRVTDSYTLEEAFAELKNILHAELTPRSLRLNSSKVPEGHKILEVAKTLGLESYGSPTLSDQALIPYPSVKIGPGDSARSHTADEFIYLKEIQEGIQGYIALLEKYFHLP
ncbi:M20 family metallo-hydrolase [Cognataquiflexum rubidum]|uniref:M20 family metallo-hydrolase n=1 Tax=Cognataquiflexum rubidum TaxID=2922273 RepID=UPI001F130721|nr:M20 family metallo-hydrolase [Cognataquiflexum rubidum]MCH6233140.1 M20 family metallo-hydrolase [Cognataquiflexum rubidum]